MVEAHADHIDNLQAEDRFLNSSINMVSNDALHNVKLMVNQFLDETARQFQKQQVDMSSLTPEAATLHLQAIHEGDTSTLRTQLSTCNDELQAKLLAVDAAQQNWLAALQVIANDVASEIGGSPWPK